MNDAFVHWEFYRCNHYDDDGSVELSHDSRRWVAKHLPTGRDLLDMSECSIKWFGMISDSLGGNWTECPITAMVKAHPCWDDSPPPGRER